MANRWLRDPAVGPRGARKSRVQTAASNVYGSLFIGRVAATNPYLRVRTGACRKTGLGAEVGGGGAGVADSVERDLKGEFFL